MSAEKIDFDSLAFEKEQCFKFLSELQTSISASLPKPRGVAAQVKKVIKAKVGAHTSQPEAAFINTFIMPVLSSHVRTILLGNADEARRALTSESHRAISDIASASPWRCIRYPFSKGLGSTPKKIVDLWRSEKGAVDKLAPDFALRNPFPHKVVFEAKYVTRGMSLDKAAEMLASSIYQGFFYRGLPKSPGGKFADYDYDYACVVIGDATKDGIVTKAWESFHPDVRKSFWDGANIFVMIV